MGAERWQVPCTAVVLAAGVGLVVLVGVLAGLTFNAHLSSDGSKVPPPLPPLTELPEQRGLDWSRAGYRDGKEPIPSDPARFTVLDYGAKGDGITDDTQGLQAALAAAHANPSGGVVYLGPGTFVLSRPLRITAPNIVIRGAGENSTTIYIPVSLSDVFEGTWSTDASGTVTTEWTSRGGFLAFSGKRTRSSDRSTLLANVDGTVEQGASVIPVDSTSEFRLGQWVRVLINDASTGVAHSSVGQVASGGSIVEFVYGDGLGDSGQPGTLGRDSVTFSATIASIGKGWIALDRELPFPVRQNWRAVVHKLEPAVEGSGVEHLTIEFKHTLMGPHLTERGYNALELDGAVNCWVRQVKILNADNAIKLRGTDHTTIAGVTIGVTQPRWSPGLREVNGHHGISVSRGHANLVTRFRVEVPLYHDVSVQGGALLNVVSDGSGADLNLDLHRSGPWGNLFTSLGMGLAQRPFGSGGRADRGAHAGRLNTFWNLLAGDVPVTPPMPTPSEAPAAAPALQPVAPAALMCSPKANTPLVHGGESGRTGCRLRADDMAEMLLLPSCDFGPLLNFVGNFAGELCNDTGWLVAGLPNDKPDLYASQLAARRGRTAPPPAMPLRI